MGSVSLGESERGLEVLGKVLGLLDGGDDREVKSLSDEGRRCQHERLSQRNESAAYLLLLLSLGAEALSTLLLLEELSLLVGGLGSLGLDEVGVVDGLGDLDGRDVNLGRGGDNVGLRDSSEGNTVDESGSGDEEKTRGELSEVDDSLSSVSSGEEDEDGSGGDGRSETGGLRGGAQRA